MNTIRIGKDKITSLKQLTSFYRNKLSSDPDWMVAGLMRIYSRQTAEEQKESETKFNNGVGFTSVDAKVLSSLAQYYKSKNKLSWKQIEILKEHMPKYAGQLVNCSLMEGKVAKIGSEYLMIRK